MSVGPVRPAHILTRVWQGVDSSTGQNISVTGPIKGFMIFVYTAGTTTLAETFVITAPSTAAHHDAVTVSQNPWPMEIEQGSGQVLFNLKAASGTVDIHMVFWR